MDNSSDNEIKTIIKNLNDEKISHKSNYKMKTSSNKNRFKNNCKVSIIKYRNLLF